MSPAMLKPCGLPVENPVTSFWLAEPSRLANHRTTRSLPPTADVVVVGSGVVGALTAYTLLKRRPGLSIVMLEARQACSGATGRNGGQIKTDPYIAYEALKAQHGSRAANELLNFEAKHFDLYQRLLEEEPIPCDHHVTTAYDLCLTDEMAEIGKRSFRSRQAEFPTDMKDYLEIEGEEHLERLSQVKGAKWGCAYRVGSIHPYKLVNGLLERCFEIARFTGGSFGLQTHTPVHALSHESGVWAVSTARGTISTPKVVLCCNGYTSSLLPEFANKIVPVRGACSALNIPPAQPLGTPSQQVMRPMFTTYSLKHRPGAFDYMISRQESPKHVVVGGAHQAFEHDSRSWYGNINDSEAIPGTKEYFESLMPRHFVNYPLDKSRAAHVWSGVLGYSSDSLPWVGPVPNRSKGLYVIAGFHGRGMVRGYGSVLASVELLLAEDGQSAEEVLLRAGLPKAYIVTEERLESKENVVLDSARNKIMAKL